jgi:hypothetical protein
MHHLITSNEIFCFKIGGKIGIAFGIISLLAGVDNHLMFARIFACVPLIIMLVIGKTDSRFTFPERLHGAVMMGIGIYFAFLFIQLLWILVSTLL